jgi:putative multiple sugar transport system permease protein
MSAVEQKTINKKIGIIEEMVGLFKGNIREYAMYIVLVAIIAIFSFITDGLFISSRNISNLINQTGYIAVLAVGMTLILIIKQIDLSVGFVAGFLGAIAAILMTKAGLSEWVTIPIILVFGLVIGLIYGFLVAKVGVPAFVATLAGQLVFRGLLLLVTEGSGTIIIPNEGFNAIGNDFIPDIFKGSSIHILTLIIGVLAIICFIYSQIKARKNMKRYNFKVVSDPIFITKLVFIAIIIFGIIWILASYNGLSWTVVIVAVVVFIYNFVMNKTTYGRYVYGIGGNAEAAELSGVNVVRVTSMVFASMGLLAALSGILFTSRLQSATTVAGNGFELDAIAAAYIGGVSANGGIGKVTGSIIGALVMSSLSSGMNLMGVGISYQYVIRGTILVLAVVFDVMTRKANK